MIIPQDREATITINWKLPLMVSGGGGLNNSVVHMCDHRNLGGGSCFWDKTWFSRITIRVQNVPIFKKKVLFWISFRVFIGDIVSLHMLFPTPLPPQKKKSVLTFTHMHNLKIWYLGHTCLVVLHNISLGWCEWVDFCLSFSILT